MEDGNRRQWKTAIEGNGRRQWAANTNRQCTANTTTAQQHPTTRPTNRGKSLLVLWRIQDVLLFVVQMFVFKIRCLFGICFMGARG
jgi:hypothetical protein